jgi:hypothetical protein
MVVMGFPCRAVPDSILNMILQKLVLSGKKWNSENQDSQTLNILKVPSMFANMRYDITSNVF